MTNPPILSYSTNAVGLVNYCRMAGLCLRGWAWFSLSLSSLMAIVYVIEFHHDVRVTSGTLTSLASGWLGSRSMLIGIPLMANPLMAFVTLALAGEAVACWYFSWHLVDGSRFVATLAITPLTLLAGLIAWAMTLCLEFVGYSINGDWTRALTMPESGLAVSSALFGCGLAYTIYLLWEIFLIKKA